MVRARAKPDPLLPFNSNKYFRSTPLDYPLISLGGYLQFWAVMYLAITLWLLRFQKEVGFQAPDFVFVLGC